MAVYLGSERKKIKLGSSARLINLYSDLVHIVNGIYLASSDNYVIKSSDGFYLTTKEANITDDIAILDIAKLDALVLA
jgi:hypothetical protein